MEAILGGIYLKEDIIEGSTIAFVIASMFLFPLIFLKLKRSYFAIVSAVTMGAFTVYAFIMLSNTIASCPHYWEIAFPFFASVNILIVATVSVVLEKKFIKIFSTVIIMIALLIAIPTGIGWGVDIKRVIMGEVESR